ncbi:MULTISPECIES: GAF and ANTAR domain-containing protein [unclassified Arthrobacter]|uniref:GAF and ANTAR domain-containing protein n=1 Tax=unclassified Arthrobacter TaxID=235627 RepID=UPI001C844D52|nr:GAF and ANTAR domain-containing protein [Arthrobacter sp. MAHUQ-56]MBX7443842.1 GAF and ANTAR domain-containing protein [Arthrobacter sp. MAHUQ-56]
MLNAEAPHDDLFADVARRLQDSFLKNPAVEACLQELAPYAAARLGSEDRQLLCAMTVLRPKHPATTAASTPCARALSQLERKYGDGPGTTAMRTGGTVLIGDARQDRRWAEYAHAVVGLGCMSVLSIPVDLEGADGVLSLYSGQAQAYNAEVVAQAEAFVLQAAKGLTLALRMVKLEETRDGLTAAMQTRTVIDLATGAIMAQNRCSQSDAFTLLRKASNARNMKLRDVAAAVVSSVAGAEGVSTYFDE